MTKQSALRELIDGYERSFDGETSKELVIEAREQLAALTAENAEWAQVVRNIVNGEYNNAREINAVERYARQELARLLAPAAAIAGEEGG